MSLEVSGRNAGLAELDWCDKEKPPATRFRSGSNINFMPFTGDLLHPYALLSFLGKNTWVMVYANNHGFAVLDTLSN